MAENAEVAVSAYDYWPLEQRIRARTVERISANLAALTFFSEKVQRIDSTIASTYAEEIEQAAFLAADEKSKDETLKPADLIKIYAGSASSRILSKLRPVEDTKMEEDNLIVDLSIGAREFLTEKRAEELLQRLFTSPITKVRFSSKSFGLEAASVAAKALENVKGSLIEADLSDIMAGQKETDALTVLAVISKALKGTKLLALDLSDNAFGEKGIRACADALKGQTALQQLSFCNNGISEFAAKAIVELMPEMPDLRLFHFHNNMSGDAGAKALTKIVAKSGKLESFRFSSTRVGSEGGVALAEALMAGNNLKSLDLRDNMFIEETAEALARTLQCHSSLRELYLSETGVGDKGAIALAKALQHSAANLEVLELSGNGITARAASALGSLVESKVDLRKVDLGENELKDRGAVLVCKGITSHHRKLEELHLNVNQITKVGAVAAASAVADLPAFKLLNLNGNYISSDGIDMLKSTLEKGSVGVHVLDSLDENDEEGVPDEDDEEEEEEEEDEEEKAELEEVEIEINELKLSI